MIGPEIYFHIAGVALEERKSFEVLVAVLDGIGVLVLVDVAVIVGVLELIGFWGPKTVEALGAIVLIGHPTIACGHAVGVGTIGFRVGRGVDVGVGVGGL